MTIINGTLEPILENCGGKAVFYGIGIVWVAELLGLERFVQGWREGMGKYRGLLFL